MASIRRQSSARFGGRGVREIQTRLEIIVDHVLNSRRSVFEPAKALAAFNIIEQDRFLSTVDKIAENSVELAYNFCHFAPRALSQVHEDDWDNWVLFLLETYNKDGVSQAIAEMQNVERYVESRAMAPQCVSFDSVSRTLELLITGLGGRSLKLVSGEIAFTDTETITLPAEIGVFDTRADNFDLYKAYAAHLWAQTRYGTWRRNLEHVTRRFPDPERAGKLLHLLETLRLNARLESDLPGLARRMRAMGGNPHIPDTAQWHEATQRLTEPDASIDDSCQFLRTLWDSPGLPEAYAYQGAFLPSKAAAVVSKRIPREKEEIKKALAQLLREQRLSISDGEEVRLDRIPDADKPYKMNFRLELEGNPVPISPELQELLESISQDMGDIPPEYLDSGGAGDDPATHSEPASFVKPHAGASGVYLYDEWDHARRKYRREWCQLRERPVPPRDDQFVEHTLAKHRNLLKRLKPAFEALRESNRRLQRQPFGDDIDLNAAVEAYIDARQGREIGEHLFIDTRKTDRNIAVMFMVDMSGSTNGWINQVEREALVLLCECLQLLGDRYAIYGFSGHTHTRCDIYAIKHMNEAYTDTVRARISGIAPQGYTRMGVAIRHLTAKLHAVDARTKLLITLSDGRPDDQDGYRGHYGIEDTRKALLEAKCLGVHPYCITIDDRAREYLPHMYGPVNFTLVDKVEKLPFNVSDIYRKLTR